LKNNLYLNHSYLLYSKYPQSDLNLLFIQIIFPPNYSKNSHLNSINIPPKNQPLYDTKNPSPTFYTINYSKNYHTFSQPSINIPKYTPHQFQNFSNYKHPLNLINYKSLKKPSPNYKYHLPLLQKTLNFPKQISQIFPAPHKNSAPIKPYFQKKIKIIINKINYLN
jgi:hypothetical protein